jgi:hypothetical protein
MNRNPLGILIITYNRPQLFENCLDRAISARGENIVPIIVIRQNSEVDYLSAIKKAEQECDAVITVNGANRTVEENINFNRICGLNYMFGVLKFENVIVLEDDAHISDLSIDFCLEAITKFGRDKKFMGVNFGSRIPFDIRLRKTYSLLRYGQHGPASLITKRAWQGMRLNQLTRLKGKVAWDGWVESYLKKGFFVTPNLSMYIDLGHSGTHTPCYENEPYFKDLENSFDDAVDAHKKFIHVQVEHSWRIDSRSYKRRNNLEYWLRDLYSRIRALTQSEEIKS